MPYVTGGLGDAGLELLDGIGEAGARMFGFTFDLLQRTGVCVCYGNPPAKLFSENFR